MRTGNKILRKLSDVSHLFLGNVIFPKTFLQQQISGVLFIAECSPYVLCRPCTATHRAYLLFEGRILFRGTPEQLAENKIVREKYLSNSFVLRKKDFQLIDEEKKAREAEENG